MDVLSSSISAVSKLIEFDFFSVVSLLVSANSLSSSSQLLVVVWVLDGVLSLSATFTGALTGSASKRPSKLRDLLGATKGLLEAVVDIRVLDPLLEYGDKGGKSLCALRLFPFIIQLRVGAADL